MKDFTCTVCGIAGRTELPQTIAQNKCITCREKEAGKKLRALE